MNKSQCIKHLQEGLVNVSFIKEDGSTRFMKSTINPELMPETERNDYTFEVATEKGFKNKDIQVVWDVEKAAWRSFRWDRVIDHYPLG